MATFANECRKAALDAITGLITNVRLDNASDVEVCTLPISWAAASTASPSVAVGTVTPDATPTANETITKFIFRTSGNATRINGTVGTSGTDWVVTDNVVPAGTTEIDIPGGISLSLSMS